MPTRLVKNFPARVALGLGGCLLAAGCGGGAASPSPAPVASTPAAGASAPTPSSAPTPRDSPSEDSPGETIDIVLTDGQVTPNGKKLAVAKGTRITLKVRSDHPDEIHVHGYDVEKAVAADKTVSVSFTAGKTGGFEVESHNPARVIVILNVR